jgi:dTMP kinase
MGIFSKKPELQTKKTLSPKGMLIVIEAVDAAGKATQHKLLLDALRAENYDVATFSFPQYDRPSGEVINEYLKSGKLKPPTPEAASLFYIIDRMSVAEEIQAALSAGKIVLCDRYTLSNAAHQGSKIEDSGERAKFYKWLFEIEYKKCGIPEPTLNIILEVTPEIALANIAARAKAGGDAQDGGSEVKLDKHEGDENHIRKATETYSEIAGIVPNCRVVKCWSKVEGLNGETEEAMRSRTAIHGQIWALVRAYIEGNEKRL